MAGDGLQVLIADDHALIRQGLIALLRAAEPAWSFREAASLAEARAQLARGGVELAVLDLRMPGMAGGVSLNRLRSDFPATRLVVLSGVDERAAILECLAAGVHGYVLKTAPTSCLIAALRQVVGGAVYVPPELARATAEPLAQARAIPPAVPAASHGPGAHAHAHAHVLGAHGPGAHVPAAAWSGFTSRQREVLGLLAEGRSTKDIARALNLGVGTVKVHLSAIYRTLGVRNRMEAVLRVAQPPE
jgi:DNA-binding NarL/FixJ family response regulator